MNENSDKQEDILVEEQYNGLVPLCFLVDLLYVYIIFMF